MKLNRNWSGHLPTRKNEVFHFFSVLSDPLRSHACAEHHSRIYSMQWSEYCGCGRADCLCVLQITLMESAQPEPPELMLHWKRGQKLHPTLIQAGSHFNKQCKPCLCQSQWLCSLKQRSWPPSCWDQKFKSHSGQCQKWLSWNYIP